MSRWLKQFPWMWKIIKGLAENIGGALNPGLVLVLDMQNVRSCPTPRLLLILMTVVDNLSIDFGYHGREGTHRRRF